MGCSLCADFELSDQVTIISPPHKKNNAGPYAHFRALHSTKGRRLVESRALNCKGPYAQCRAVRSKPGRTLKAGPHDQCRGRTINAGDARSMQDRTLNAGRSMQGPCDQCSWPCDQCRGRTLDGAYAPCRGCTLHTGPVRSLKSRTVTEEPNGPFGQCRAVRSTRNAGRHIQRMVQCRGCTLNVGGWTLDAGGLGHDRSYGPCIDRTAETVFQSVLGQCVLCVSCVCCCVLFVCVVVVFKIFVVLPWTPRPYGTPSTGRLPPDRPKFRSFPSHHIFILSSLFWGSFR